MFSLFSIGLAASVFIIGFAFTVDDCPAGLPKNKYLKIYGNNCYRFLTNKMKDFESAEDYCRYYGGELAMVKTQSMNTFVRNTIKSYHHYHRDYTKVWIGLRYSNAADRYQWEDGSVAEYTNFADRSNSYGDDDDDDCVYMQVSSGKWYNHDCKFHWRNHAKHYFVCEYPLAVPTKSELVGCPKNLPWDENLKTNGNKCYRFVVEENQFTNFKGAQTDCRRDAGNLAVVKTKQVSNFIAKHLDDATYDVTWIGLRYHKSSNGYKWVDGTDLDNNFDKFGEGQMEEEGDCVAMDANGYWLAQFCDDKHYYNEKHAYVCEYPNQATVTAIWPSPKTTQGFYATVSTSPEITTTMINTDGTTSESPEITTARAQTVTHKPSSPSIVSVTQSTIQAASASEATTTCDTLICELNCGLDGFARSNTTGCMVCSCNKRS